LGREGHLSSLTVRFSGVAFAYGCVALGYGGIPFRNRSVTFAHRRIPFCDHSVDYLLSRSKIGRHALELRTHCRELARLLVGAVRACLGSLQLFFQNLQRTSLLLLELPALVGGGLELTCPALQLVLQLGTRDGNCTRKLGSRLIALSLGDRKLLDQLIPLGGAVLQLAVKLFDLSPQVDDLGGETLDLGGEIIDLVAQLTLALAGRALQLGELRSDGIQLRAERSLDVLVLALGSRQLLPKLDPLRRQLRPGLSAGSGRLPLQLCSLRRRLRLELGSARLETDRALFGYTQLLARLLQSEDRLPELLLQPQIGVLHRRQLLGQGGRSSRGPGGGLALRVAGGAELVQLGPQRGSVPLGGCQSRSQRLTVHQLICPGSPRIAEVELDCRPHPARGQLLRKRGLRLVQATDNRGFKRALRLQALEEPALPLLDLVDPRLRLGDACQYLFAPRERDETLDPP